MKTAFIGHRQILHKDVEKRLYTAIESKILQGCRYFTMGTHGDFDKLALKVCRTLRKKYTHIVIEVVLTSLHGIDKSTKYKPYADVQTIIYATEEVHYKKKITWSNQQMLQSCSTVICYAKAIQNTNTLQKNQFMPYKSGTTTALLYAQKQGLQIINLYREEDSLFTALSTKEEE